MKNKQLVLEHSEMMFYSKELIQMHVPEEINLMFYTMLLFFVGVFICLGTIKINDVKRVSGIVKTYENNSTVNNVLPGKIEAIYYVPNQFVQKGELLYSLNRESYEAIKTNLEKDIENTKEQILCMNMLLDGFNSGKNQVSEKEQLVIFSQLQEYLSTVAYYENQIEILEYKVLIEENKPKPLFDQHEYDDAYLRMNLSLKELEKYKASFLADVSQRKNEYELHLEKLLQEKIKNENEYSFLEMRAPIDGYVQECSSLNVGDFIFANQTVLNIIPSDKENFKIELAISSKDIGEIKPGMLVKYRLSAFPFFEYRGAQGNIKSIDSDIRKNSDGRYFYQAYGDIDRVSFTNNRNEEFPLRAGIEVNALIVMEKIHLYYFILRKLNFME